MDTYETISEAILEAHKAACGWRGGQDTQYYNDEAGKYGFINHERGHYIELREGLAEICQDYNNEYDEAYRDGMEAYREWYEESFLREFEAIVFFHTPLVAKVLHYYDSSDGHGGDLAPSITAEQCVDRYIRLLAEEICNCHSLEQDDVEKEIRERITEKGQTEEEIRLALNPSVKKAVASLDTPGTEATEIDLF